MSQYAAAAVLVLWLSLLRGNCDDQRPEPPCPAHLSIAIPEDAAPLSNGSLLHAGLLYPPDSHWHDGNSSRGCVCRVSPAPCLRKCCGPGQLVSPSLGELGQCVPAGAEPEAELGLEEARAEGPMRTGAGRARLRDWFTLFESPRCAEELVLLELSPEQYPEDEYLLLANGSLWVQALGVLPVGWFCLDRRLGAPEGQLAVLACLEREKHQLEEESQTAVRIGYMLSVPFLAVTFLVYAIIPELRNIYGKTLMCYVVSLLTAYSSISVSNFFHYGTACTVTGEFSLRPG